MERPIVIYVVESGGMCGGVRIILEHINHLRSRGWHVEVYSLDQNKPTWFPLTPSCPWWRFETYDQLVQHLSRRNARKVGTWWKTAYAVAEASKPGEGFYLIQDIETSYYSTQMEKELVQETYDLPLTQYTTSRWVEEQMPDVHYVGIGIDQELYRVTVQERQLNAIMSLSRPQALKGWSTYCEAHRKLHHTNKFTMYSFGIMGAHPPFSRALPQGLPDEELVKWYNRIGIFLSASWHEGFSLTLIEAMACGAVVICADAKGNMQFCENEVNSLVVPRGDAQALVDACLWLIDNPTKMMELQQAGFETAKQWPWEPVIDRLEALYVGTPG